MTEREMKQPNRRSGRRNHLLVLLVKNGQTEPFSVYRQKRSCGSPRGEQQPRGLQPGIKETCVPAGDGAQIGASALLFLERSKVVRLGGRSGGSPHTRPVSGSGADAELGDPLSLYIWT